MVAPVKSPERIAVETYIREHEQEVRSMLLDGMMIKDLALWVEAGSGVCYSCFRVALHDAIPDTPKLLKAGKARAKEKLEAAVAKAYAANEGTFEEIVERFHISSTTLNGIIRKYHIKKAPQGKKPRDKQKETYLKKYLASVGTVVYDKIYGSPLKVLEFIPVGKCGRPAVLVECLDCGNVFEAPAMKTISYLNTYCSCNIEKDNDGNFEERDRHPPCVIESRATIWCRCCSTECPTNGACHVCCAECYRRKICNYDKCHSSPQTCCMSRKRTKAEGLGAWL